MVSFKEFIVCESTNTLISDVNEILTGYYINNKKWFDAEAKSHLLERKQQISSSDYARADGHAQVMAKEFLSWALKHGYKGVQQVFWTARPGALAAATGIQNIDSRKNPSDILVKFKAGPKTKEAYGFLGLSAKSTKGKSDIGFKNPGLGPVDSYLNAGLGIYYNSELNKALKEFKLPINAQERKLFIRQNSSLKSKTEARGVKILSKLRDILFNVSSKLSDNEKRMFIKNLWMDAGAIVPPYVKVTGFGNKPPYTAVVNNPQDNEKISALENNKITFEKVGNDSVGVKAGGTRIMKMRFKFESEKLASSVKMSGDPW